MCNNISGIESVDALNVDYCTCFKIFQMGSKDKHKTRGPTLPRKQKGQKKMKREANLFKSSKTPYY